MIVRGEARRLRLKLHQYYDTEGNHDPILIDVPKGAYAAVFRERDRGILDKQVGQSISHYRILEKLRCNPLNGLQAIIGRFRADFYKYGGSGQENRGVHRDDCEDYGQACRFERCCHKRDAEIYHVAVGRVEREHRGFGK